MTTNASLDILALTLTRDVVNSVSYRKNTHTMKNWNVVKKGRYNMFKELQAVNDRHKSFYGKALVDTLENGNKFLLSYGTLVAAIIDGHVQVYGTYSATTLRHIKEFLWQHNFKAESKKQIIRDYCL
jgi:hypothetical protein